MSVRRLLWLLPVFVLLLVATIWYWLLHSQSGARWIWSRVESATNGALSAEEISGSLAAGVTGRAIGFVGDGVTVSLAEAALSIEVELLPVRVVVMPTSLADLSIDLAADRNSPESTDIRDTLAKLRLPVELVFTHVEVDRFVIGGKGGEAFAVDGATLVGRWHDSILLEDVNIDAPLVAATGSGRLVLRDAFDVTLDLDLVAKRALTGFDSDSPLAVTLQGPLDDLTIQARSDEPRAFLRGQVSGISSAVRWDLRLDVPALDLPSTAAAVDLPPLELVATGRGDTTTFRAEAQVGLAGTDFHVDAAAEVNVSKATVSSDLKWRNVRWPVGDAEPRVQSHAGRVRLTGSLDAWAVAGMLDIEVPHLPPGQLTIDGHGDRDGLSVEILDGDVFGGSVSGRAEYSWREARAYAAQLELENVRTDTLLPEWPADLSGRANLNGQQSPFRLSVSLSDVSGRTGGRPLRADGRVEIIEGLVSVDELHVVHGESSIVASGELYSADGLQYDLVVDDLGHYFEESFGSFSASGIVSLKPAAQFLRLDATSAEMGWRDLRISRLTIADRGGGILHAEASAENIELGMFDTGELRLVAQLGQEAQSVDVEMQSGALRTALSVHGAVDSWDDPSTWTGQISRLAFEHDQFTAALDDPADIRVSQQRSSVDRLCLVGDNGMKSCTDARWDTESGFELAQYLSAVPIDLVNAFIDTGLTFGQVADGELEWRQRPDGAPAGRGDFTIMAGKIVSGADPDLEIETGLATVGFNLDGDSLHGGEIHIPFPGLGQIEAKLEVLDVADERGSEIDGIVDIDLDNVGLLNALVPALDSAAGQLTADVRIGGRVGAPLISGGMTIQNGALSYLPIGLQLREIELSGELQENGEVEMAGSFRAGDGRAEIRTRADHALTATKGLELDLRGENLTIIDVPDVRAVAATDLRVNFDGRTLEVNGGIDIPHARITAANFAVTRIYESEDAIIVAGELPDDPTGNGRKIDLDFMGSVELSLGSDVVVDLDVVQPRVTGSTVFTWSGDPMPNALGRFDIDGEILALGQRLEIAEGFLRFDDVPADDPYLRIRAEREIFGNTQVRRAGVLVAGTRARTTVEPYTEPATTEERALTLLVTGSDFDFDRGVGAVDVGTYIAPRIFVSYGVALFDEENVVRIRYDLRRGFGVTLTSGGREAGADLIYRIEN